MRIRSSGGRQIVNSSELEAELTRVFAESDIVWSEKDVTGALDRMAADIDAAIGDRNPVVLCVMLGGLIPAARLLERFEFPLQLDYLHVTRYRGGTEGHDLNWKACPATTLADREVLIIDDILDEGVTLRGVITAGNKVRARYTARYWWTSSTDGRKPSTGRIFPALKWTTATFSAAAWITRAAFEIYVRFTRWRRRDG